MTKTCKKSLILIFLALCFATCLFLFASCKDETPVDNAVTYTVTVKTDETTPANGVKVTMKKGGATFETKETNAEGKVEFDLAPDSYDVALSSLPAHFEMPQNATLSVTAENRELTVTLAKKFGYVVKLVNPDNTPYFAQGVSVGVCTLAGNCLQPVALEANGVAIVEDVAKADYHVKITDLPKTAAYECDKDGYYTGKNFSATETEMTITIYPVTPVTDATPMTNEEKTAYAAKNTSFSATNDAVAYHFTKALKAGETAYYSVTPEFNGDFKLYKDANASYLTNDTVFVKGNVGTGLYSFPGLIAGKTYYFNVSNVGTEDITAEFVVEAPVASYTQLTAAGTANVTIAKEGANAIIELTPSAAASFKLTVQSEQHVNVLSFDASYKAETATHSDEQFAANAECSAKLTEDKIGNSIYFSIAVKDAASYPVTLKVTVEKLHDLENTTTVLHTTETLTNFEDQTNKELTFVPVDGTAVLVFNDTDKFYHLGTADGPVVVVKLTEGINDPDRCGYDGELVYLDKEGRFNPYVVETTSESDKADLAKGKTFDDYRFLLRGFADYEYVDGPFGPAAEIPTNITEASYYAKCVNKDGVYPLTKELEKFLKAIAAKDVADAQATGSWSNMPMDAVAGCEWLFACYYYKEAEAAQPDVIVGEYEFVTMGGTSTLTVNADGSYSLNDGMGTVNGTWVKGNDGNYTFTEKNATFGDIVFVVVRDAQTGALKFFDKENNTEMTEPDYEYSPKQTEDVIVGEYEFVTMGRTTTLTVKADGSYSLNDGMGTVNGTWVKGNDGNYTFTEKNATFGDIVYVVVREAQTGALKFFDKENNTEMTEPDYEYSPKQTEDVIVGEYEFVTMGRTTTLTVKADGSYSLNDGMATTNGTWVKGNDGNYTFTEKNATFGDIVFIVIRDAQTGALKFFDKENNPDMVEPDYEYEVAKA